MFWAFMRKKNRMHVPATSRIGSTLFKNQLSRSTWSTTGSMPFSFARSSIFVTSVAYRIFCVPSESVTLAMPVGVSLLGAISTLSTSPLSSAASSRPAVYGSCDMMEFPRRYCMTNMMTMKIPSQIYIRPNIFL